ncbi:LysR family transcriptional regulator [Pseudanabaena sp. FACHB-1277]|uniref:LysR family transcriptional regulator n=1 Tax=Pseudanabaena cinerea FACHB-1277 TaxID=2949581 RepID=A0A926Z595_9CYAN|nr:LysR family transcriptional regulator [Pseudanabaena cinerea]MBD2149377.1 LysR family transcriptional regulator [Pseudanabaena cinerea FACHB-1277]
MGYHLSDSRLASHVTLHQLQVFEVAARHGSYTRAAEELFLTQPTVSMQIKHLTKAVGMPLFEQVGKRLFLTQAGQELFKTCQEIFGRISQFEMSVANMKGLKQGCLKISVVTTAKYVVPRLLGPFCQRYPGVEISLKVTNHSGILERLSENKDDLYILSQVPDEPDVKAHQFLSNPLVVLANHDHPLVSEKNIPIQKLAEQPFITRESGSGTRSYVQKLFDQHNIKPMVKIELSSNEAIKQAIAGGLGISVLSRHTIALEGASGQIAVLDVEHFPIPCHWYVIHLAGKQLSVVAQAFLDYLKTEGKQIAEDTSW